MRVVLISLGVIAVLLVGGCHPGGTSTRPSHGRYEGVGLYPANQMWAQMIHPTVAGDPATTKLDDDEQIIVTVDSQTGEVRQCGNLTGYCVAMNPWAGSLGTPQTAPLHVKKHAEQLMQEAVAQEKQQVSSAQAR
jgi:hypothetical protein